MINLPVEASIEPTEARIAGATGGMVEDRANRWYVKYKYPTKVRDFLQTRGLRNQNVDREPLAKALLAGLLPDIFGKVFENGARPHSGYSCHDGEIKDASQGDVTVVYTHVQFWNHYQTDPIKDGLSGCGLGVKIESADALPIPVDSMTRKQFLKIMFDGSLQRVLSTRPEFKEFDDLWQKGVFSYGTKSKNDGCSRASLVMHPVSPVYSDIENAVELYKTVVDVIKGAEGKFEEFADLVHQRKVADGLLGKLRESSNAFSTAFRETGEGADYEQHLAGACNFAEGKREFLNEHVRTRQQRVLTDLTTAFEPLRDRMVAYFTQPLFTTETR